MPSRVERIGQSVEGAPLLVHHFGDPSARLRVLFVCGQHGDERAIRKSIRLFMERDAEAWTAKLPLSLAILADANPDGRHRRVRENAQGIDLNRDHLWLQAPETRAIHGFVRLWRPHLVVDAHNYPARRRHLVEQGLRLSADVCLDVATSPAAGIMADAGPFAEVFRSLQALAAANHFDFGRYVIHARDGSVRHSTPALGDARNTITLRHETPVLLLEARNPARADSPEQKRALHEAVAAVCGEICEWAARRADELCAFALPSEAGLTVPLGYRRLAGSMGKVPVRSLATGASIDLVCRRDRRTVRPRRSRQLPGVYVVPEAETRMVAMLARQGFAMRIGSGAVELSPNQRGGRLLALILDPRSRYRRRIAAERRRLA